MLLSQNQLRRNSKMPVARLNVTTIRTIYGTGIPGFIAPKRKCEKQLLNCRFNETPMRTCLILFALSNCELGLKGKWLRLANDI